MAMLLMEETRAPGKNHRKITEKLYHLNFVSNLLRHEREWANLQTLVILDTDCYCFNYHMITVPMF